jgi:hypothetical protein
MVALQINTNNEDGTDLYTYLNETSVGQGGDNRRRSDIQLVQFFLDQFYIENQQLFRLLPQTRPVAVSIDFDGKVGRQTIEGIRLFQRNWCPSSPIMIADGKVSVPSTSYFGVPGTTTLVYTIFFMNVWFFSISESAGGNAQWKGNLRNHPMIKTCAPELQAELALLEG